MKDSKKDCFNQAYIDDYNKVDLEKKNNIIVLNFEVENVEQEYTRIKNLCIG